MCTSLLLTSCGGEIGKTLRNEKKKTNDEFLVKKREPLSMPPDYSKLPEPRTIESDKKEEDANYKKILKIEKEKNTNIKSKKSVEKSILEKIKK